MRRHKKSINSNGNEIVGCMKELNMPNMSKKRGDVKSSSDEKKDDYLKKTAKETLVTNVTKARQEVLSELTSNKNRLFVL